MSNVKLKMSNVKLEMSNTKCQLLTNLYQKSDFINIFVLQKKKGKVFKNLPANGGIQTNRKLGLECEFLNQFRSQNYRLPE